MSILLWFAIIYAKQKNTICKMFFILTKHQYHGTDTIITYSDIIIRIPHEVIFCKNQAV